MLLKEMRPEVREEAQGQQAKAQKGGTSESLRHLHPDSPQNHAEP